MSLASTVHVLASQDWLFAVRRFLFSLQSMFFAVLHINASGSKAHGDSATSTLATPRLPRSTRQAEHYVFATNSATTP